MVVRSDHLSSLLATEVHPRLIEERRFHAAVGLWALLGLTLASWAVLFTLAAIVTVVALAATGNDIDAYRAPLTTGGVLLAASAICGTYVRRRERRHICFDAQAYLRMRGAVN